MKNRVEAISVSILCCLALTFNVPTHAQGSPEWKAGVQAYGQKDYRGAAAHFENCMAAGTTDATTAYYLALSSMQSGNMSRAKQMFQYITTNFPTSREANLSAPLLPRFGIAPPKPSKSPESSQVAPTNAPIAATTSAQTGMAWETDKYRTDAEKAAYKAELATLPGQAEFKFKSGEQGHMLVDAYINGHVVPCEFDTGAGAFIGKNHLLAAGIKPPTGPSDGETSGWAGKAVPTWHMNASVRLGNLTRTIPITVAEEYSNYPLIGQDFVRDYQYSIDREGGRFTMKKGHSASNIDPLYDIPCTFDKERDYVYLEINKKKRRVLLDTGASSTIISTEDAKGFGIEVPAGSPQLTMVGVGGNLNVSQVPVDVKLGPITRRGFNVNVGGETTSAIGQDFMSGWRFTVDRDQHLLRFFH